MLENTEVEVSDSELFCESNHDSTFAPAQRLASTINDLCPVSDPDLVPGDDIPEEEPPDDSHDFRHSYNREIEITAGQRKKVLRVFRKVGKKMIRRQQNVEAQQEILAELMKKPGLIFDIDELRQEQLPIVKGTRKCVAFFVK